MPVGVNPLTLLTVALSKTVVPSFTLFDGWIVVDTDGVTGLDRERFALGVGGQEDVLTLLRVERREVANTPPAGSV